MQGNQERVTERDSHTVGGKKKNLESETYSSSKPWSIISLKLNILLQPKLWPMYLGRESWIDKSPFYTLRFTQNRSALSNSVHKISLCLVKRRIDKSMHNGRTLLSFYCNLEITQPKRSFFFLSFWLLFIQLQSASSSLDYITGN